MKRHFSNLYTSATTSGEHDREEIKVYMKKLTKLLTEELPRVHQHTMFHCKGRPTARSWEITENEWTCRLAYCLPQYLPCGFISSYSGEEGQQFDDLQWSYSGIKLADMYIFQGAPDIILSKRKTPELGNPDESLLSGSTTEGMLWLHTYVYLDYYVI